MDVQTINKKLVSGFITLVARKAILDAVSFITLYIILAKILPLEVLGVYIIASSILAFFSYFSDFGLSASIVQKKDVLHIDLKTAFLVQSSFALIIMVGIWIAAPILAPIFKLDLSGMWLIRALGVAFFLTSLKVIPSNLLERELRFQQITLVDIIETLVFNGTLVILTFKGFGVYSFAWATLARSSIGAAVLYTIAPWQVGIGFSKESAKALLNFGVPFQLNSVLALLKDRLTPLITAAIIGPLGTSYVGWAQGIAYRPLEVMSIVIRVTFPAYSRLQDNNQELKKIIERSLFLTVLFLYPMIFGLLAVAPAFIDLMGKTKFSPALHLIYLFAFSTFWAAPSTTFTNVLSAIGKVGITLKLMVMWTLLTWILSPLLALVYGYTGVALAAAIISFSSIIPIIIVVRMLKIDLIGSIWQPLLAAILMSIGTYLFCLFLVDSIFTLFIAIGFGAALYGGIMLLLGYDRVMDSLRRFRDAKKNIVD